MSAKESKELRALNRLAQAAEETRDLLALHCAPPRPAELAAGVCWRWEARALGGGALRPLPPPDNSLPLLLGLQDIIAPLEANLRRFLAGKPANHALLTGPRGCGKSSVVRGLCGKYAKRGLRLIETDVAGLAALPALAAVLRERQEKFLIYCDDLSFANADADIFNRLKSAIDGGFSAPAGNALLCATSNRRNLVAQTFADNLPQTQEEINPHETNDEKIALADRFGLWLPFYAPDQEEYDALVDHWLRQNGIKPSAALRLQGRQFADYRGSRNGRMARQFAVGAAAEAGKK